MAATSSSPPTTTSTRSTCSPFTPCWKTFPRRTATGLARMAEFLASITSDSGELPFLGDDDGGRFFSPYGHAITLRPRDAGDGFALLLGKRFFAYYAARRGRDRPVVAWAGALQDHLWRCVRTSIPRVRRQRHRRHAPRRRCAPCSMPGRSVPGSGGHSHSDTLSLVVTSGDHEVLIDSGTYSYMDPEWRELFRGSSAHNTIRIDGLDQAIPTVHFAGRRSRKCRCLSLPATLRAIARSQCAATRGSRIPGQSSL